MPGRTGFSAFILKGAAEIVLLSAVIYIFITFSRKRDKILIKSLTLFFVSVPLIFLLFHYAGRDNFNAGKKKYPAENFPYSEVFYENPVYSLYTAESGNRIIKKGILISKDSGKNSFTVIRDSKIREAGKNSFYISLENDEMFFSQNFNQPETMMKFFNIFGTFTDKWKKEAETNSIMLLVKISVFIIYILSLTAIYSISIFPIVNFVFYSAASFPVIYFLRIYSRIIIPAPLLNKIPSAAGENWGYAAVALISVILIFRKLISIPLQRKRRK